MNLYRVMNYPMKIMDDLRDSGQCLKSVTLSNVRTTKNGMIYKTMASVADSVTLSNVRPNKEYFRDSC